MLKGKDFETLHGFLTHHQEWVQVITTILEIKGKRKPEQRNRRQRNQMIT